MQNIKGSLHNLTFWAEAAETKPARAEATGAHAAGTPPAGTETAGTKPATAKAAAGVHAAGAGAGAATAQEAGVSRQSSGLYSPSDEHDACGLGILAELTQNASHQLILDALTMLKNLEHRGATGGDGKSGDGAGILCQIPDAFFRREMGLDAYVDATQREISAEAPSIQTPSSQPLHELPYGIGMFFLPPQPIRYIEAKRMIEKIAGERKFQIIAWRDVPVRPQVLGERAQRSMPRICQAALIPAANQSAATASNQMANMEFDLFLLRKHIEAAAKECGYSIEDFYIPSLSCRTIVYKGMFVASQFANFYPDLDDPAFASRFAIVHQRYSTNTFPSWPLAQPFRMIAHNGEINTLKKNMNSMRARQATMASEKLGSDFFQKFPAFEEKGSDSSIFDNIFELLALSGREPEQVFMMMVQEPISEAYHHSIDKKAFYEYFAALLETWDGPAAMSFTEGIRIGAASDRNGLRPFRYTLFDDGFFLGSSETGVLQGKGTLNDRRAVSKGILKPGEMLVADLAEGRLISDSELKLKFARKASYRRWLSENQLELRGLFTAPEIRTTTINLARNARYFGFNRGCISALKPMILQKQEAVSAMGTKKPPAILSHRIEPLSSYFKQRFAQVTNPPIDPLRETLVMSLENYIGTQHNLLEEGPQHCHQLRLQRPILSNDDMEKLKHAAIPDFKVSFVSILVPCQQEVHAASENGAPEPPALGALEHEVRRICKEAEQRIDEGANLIILSDRGVDETHASVPALLALSAVHTSLVQARKRHRAGLILETGDARSVHDIALFLAFGASGVNPWIVFELLFDLKKMWNTELDTGSMADNFIEAADKGILKIMSKSGISTISSYRGSRLVEAVGLSDSLVETWFKGVESKLGGIGIKELEEDMRIRHKQFLELPTAIAINEVLNIAEAEQQPWPPQAAASLFEAVKTGNQQAWRRYVDLMENPDSQVFAFRDTFSFRIGRPIPLELVQPASEIVQRFSIAAMSLGAISPEAHEALTAGANSIGAWSNSGEGGEDFSRARYRDRGMDSRTASRQIASARFGVTAHYAATAAELQIKIAQGAKPGEGGQLPGTKVNSYIAALRHAKPGQTLISPPPHHDIYSIEDLSQLIHDLRCVNPFARIAVKLAAQSGTGTVAAGVAKAGADCIIVSSGDGGTGAAPLSSLDHAGNYWETSLPEIRQVLAMNGFDISVVVQVDGRLRTARDIIIAAILGAREFAFGTAAMITMGCIACGQCNLGSCPVGIATQDESRRAHFKGEPEYLARFFRFLAEDVRELLARLEVRTLDELGGRHDLLVFPDQMSQKEKCIKLGSNTKAALVDFSKIREALEIARRYPMMDSLDSDSAEAPALPLPEAGLRNFKPEKRGGSAIPEIEAALLPDIISAITRHTSFSATIHLSNADRSIGAGLSGELARRGLQLSADSVQLTCRGVAGQSFGAFLVHGITLRMEGEVNDYVGKSLSGGRIIVKPAPEAEFEPENNVIAGNVCLYGATEGEAFFNGRAGERFCVRNSGALAVVEGVGNHACEYMTDGTVVILGPTGVNFGAGMTGGTAFVLDEDRLFDTRCNLADIDVKPVTKNEDSARLRQILTTHVEYTGSPKAQRILEGWDQFVHMFVKVVPVEPVIRH